MYFILPFASLGMIVKKAKVSNLVPVLPGLCAILGMAAWYFLSKDLYIPLRNNVNPFSQAQFMINNPLEFAHIFFNTSIGNRSHLINQFVGNLGWLDTPLNINVSYLYIALLLLSVLFDQEVARLYPRIINFIAASATFVLISVTMYLSWTPVKNKEILGLVGKNFIPLSIFAISIFRRGCSFRGKEILNYLFKVVPVPVLFYTVWILISRYYIAGQ
jgi:uncharacterized membrane protein